MARSSRSIFLVLIGTGLALPACDDRNRRYGPPSAGSPSYSPVYAQSSSPSYGTGPYPTTAAAGSASSYRGSTYAGSRLGTGWVGGSAGSTGRGGSARGASPSDSPAEASHGTTFGGFGAHASSDAGGAS